MDTPLTRVEYSRVNSRAAGAGRKPYPMFELFDPGKDDAEYVVLISERIDLNHCEFVRDGTIRHHRTAVDGTRLYVPANFHARPRRIRSDFNWKDAFWVGLGCPSYIFCIFHPLDLQECDNPTLELLSECPSWLVDVIISSPFDLSLPARITDHATFHIVNQCPTHPEASLFGLIALMNRSFLINIRMKDFREDFGPGAKLAVGFAEHEDLNTAALIAARQVTDDFPRSGGFLIGQSPNYPQLSLDVLGHGYEGSYAMGWEERLKLCRAIFFHFA